MNGQTSGRSSAAPNPSANAWPWWSSRWRSIANSDERDQDALGVAHHRVAQPVGRQQQAERGDRPGGPAGRAAADHPAGQAKRHQQRQQAACARDDEPQVGRGVAEQRERCREQDGQRLPRRAGVGVQLELEDVAPPLDPRPRVVGGGGGVEQRQRGQRHCGRDRDRERVVTQDVPRVRASRARGQAQGRRCRPRKLRSRWGGAHSDGRSAALRQANRYRTRREQHGRIPGRINTS